MKRLLLLALALLLPARLALANTEAYCGNGVDDDTDGEADEGCYPDTYLHICESPLPCDTAGAPEPNGGVRLPRPPDISVKVPYGPPLEFQRFYTSHHYLNGNGGTFQKPLGPGFQHNFMGWLKGPASATPSAVIMHARTGQELVFTYDSSDGTWRYYQPQAGYHMRVMKQRIASPYNWELENLDGTGLTFDWNANTGIGRMTALQDSLATPNVVTLSYNDTDVNKVTNILDASGTREFVISYNGAGNIDQLILKENGTARVTKDYEYTSGRLTSVEQGGAVLESYTWDTGIERLLTVENSGSVQVEYVWNSAGTNSGKIARIHTPTGSMGISGFGDQDDTKYHFYDLGLSCTSDTPCGTAESGSTCHFTTIPDGPDQGTDPDLDGVCFRAYRSAVKYTGMADRTFGTVTGSCSSCNDVDEYAWYTGSGNSDLSLKGHRSADGSWTSYSRDGNGMITKIVENDDDAVSTTVPTGARVTYLFYQNSSFPGLVTERRIQSELSASTCDANTATGCKRTLTTYGSDGKATAVEDIGFTLDASGSVISFDYTTGYEYDSVGRLTAVRGPRASTYDDTEYVYWSSSDSGYTAASNGYLRQLKRRTGASSYLTTTSYEYDHWGNATRVLDPNSKAVCKTFESYFGLVASSRVVMGGSHTNCASSDSSDMTTSYGYDKARRLTSTTKPSGNCVTQGYDAAGRLVTVQNSDACAANGDTITHTYDDDGHITKTQWKVNGSTLTREHEYTYADDRRVASEKNPVDTSKVKQWFYDDDGLPAELRFEDYSSTDARTQWDVDNLNRTTAERRYTTSSSNESWSVTAGVQLMMPTRLRDNASHDIDLVWDDLSRKVKQVTPETGTILYVRDEAGNVVTRVEADGDADEVTNTFTYDTLNRALAEDYGDSSCGTGQGAEIQYSYDALPGGVSCPSGSTCNLPGGRLAYVKTKIACDTNAGDKTLDQLTFYSYDNAGRIDQHTVKDDSGRVGKTIYYYDKNSNPTYIVYPSGNYSLYAYGGMTTYYSDLDRPTYLYRNSTMLMYENFYAPWGPGGSPGFLLAFDHGGTMYLSKYSKGRDLAMRPTDWYAKSGYSTPDNILKIAYGQDARGRISKRDFSYGTAGQIDQFFLYDDLSRVTCRSRTQQSSCPTTGSDLMENVTYNASSDRSSLIIKNAALAQQTQTYTYDSSKPEQIDYITLSGGGQVNFAYDGRGNREADDDSNYTGAGDEKREYTYDARNNLITVSGQYLAAANDLNTYVMTNAYDERNRRIFKSFKDTITNQEAQWFFYYDQWDKLVQAIHTPDVADSNDYSIYEWFYVEGEPTVYYQSDYVNGANTATTRRFLFNDEQGRPHTAWTFPSSGSAVRAWEVEAGSWGTDSITAGTGTFQPIVFPGQFRDAETTASLSNGSEVRSALVYNWHRHYDPTIGSYVSPDNRHLASREGTYTYALNSPTEETDPAGLRTSSPFGSRVSQMNCQELPPIYNPDPKTGGELAEKFQECFGTPDDEYGGEYHPWFGDGWPPDFGGTDVDNWPTNPGGWGLPIDDTDDCAFKCLSRAMNLVGNSCFWTILTSCPAKLDTVPTTNCVNSIERECISCMNNCGAPSGACNGLEVALPKTPKVGGKCVPIIPTWPGPSY